MANKNRQMNKYMLLAFFSRQNLSTKISLVDHNIEKNTGFFFVMQEFAMKFFLTVFMGRNCMKTPRHFGLRES